MNIDKWVSRIKNRHLPKDFNHEGSENFISNWEYCKSLSNYHFDNTISDDSSWYEILGRFDSDWDQELECLIENKSKKPLRDRPWATGGENPLKKQESYDRMIMGIPDDQIPYYHAPSKLVRERCPIIMSMIEYFKFEKFVFGVQMQYPGQFLQLHIDKFQHRYPTDTAEIVRIQIMLTDYDYGQMFSLGNDVYSHWKRGQILIEDWHNVPHSMINAGKNPVCWIALTGIRSEETDLILERLDKNSVIKI